MLAVAGLATASMALLYLCFHLETLGHRRALAERGEAVLDSLAAGIKSRGGYMRQCCLKRLGETLGELAQNPGIIGVQVYNEPTHASVKGGVVSKTDAVNIDSPQWEPGKFTLVKKYTFKPPEGAERPPCEEEQKNGMPPTPLWTCGSYIFTVVLNTSEVDAMLRRDRIQFTVAIFVLFGCSVLSVVAIRYRMRQNKLEAVLLVTQERSVHLDRLAQLGAGLAHETKNPLGVVRGLAQGIEEAPNIPPEVKDLASRIVDETDETVGQINAFLSFARPPEPHCVNVSLKSFCENILVLVRTSAQRAGVVIENRAENIAITADEMLLRRAILNLVNNALKATGKAGTISLETAVGNGTVTLTVADTGTGIAPEDLPRVTEPYFGRFDGGSGLGLPIVEQIARAHGWTLLVESSPGNGARVSLQGLRAGTLQA
jgi:signal transduction histidine kinase